MRRCCCAGSTSTSSASTSRPPPTLPPTVPLTKDDFHDIAKLGFNSVRLIVSWSRLEPSPGAYDTAYVGEIRQAVRWAAAYDLYVVLDMHQDAYGIAVDTPQGTTCPEGTTPNNGWDGAPAWATLTDGASTCRPGERELAPAVMHAWQHFWDDTDGIQTHLVDTWGRLAHDFAKARNVAGFDLLNEPGFGLDPSANGTTDLGAFYGRAIDAIRAGETAGGGFHHVVFWEPNVLWSAFGNVPVPDPGFTKDKNLVFAPHIYAESLSSNSIPGGFASAQKVAKRTASPCGAASGASGPSTRSTRRARSSGTPPPRTPASTAARGGTGSRPAATPTS